MLEGQSFQDYVRAWIGGSAEPPPIAQLLGIRLTRSEGGEGRAEMSASEKHHNAMGTLHGGVFGHLADVAIGAAMVSVLNPGETFTTISLAVDFLRGTRNGEIIADARVVKRGRAVVFCECHVHDNTGQALADVRSSCLIRASEQARALP